MTGEERHPKQYNEDPTRKDVEMGQGFDTGGRDASQLYSKGKYNVATLCKKEQFENRVDLFFPGSEVTCLGERLSSEKPKS